MSLEVYVLSCTCYIEFIQHSKLIFTGLLLFGIGMFFFAGTKKQALMTNTSVKISASMPTENTNTAVLENTNVSPVPEPLVNTNSTTPLPMPIPKPSVVTPITDFFNRVTKKPFGIYITLKTSPIQPEKFSGYHTGADAETTPAEKDSDVPIAAIADGTVVFAGHVNGYGGVIMIEHKVNGETITALYGHLRITSFTIKKGAAVTVGKNIAVLGTGYSSETDGERKHLHFGIIKGASINYKGYVQTPSGLTAWDDPVTWLTTHGGV